MASVEYLDCRLELTASETRLMVDDRDYRGRPALTEATRRGLRAATDPRDYGRLLFSALLPRHDDVHDGYLYALSIAEDRKARLRLRLDISPHAAELHHYQWEHLYDPERDTALACSLDTAFSRYLSVPAPPAPEVTGKPRLLVVLSNPENLEDYGLARPDVGEMRQAIISALAPLRNLLSFELFEGPGTPDRIRRKLIQGKFHALHLQCHGRLAPGKSAGLALEKEDRTVDFVKEEEISQIFEGNRELCLVVLIACHGGDRSMDDDPFSGVGPRLVRRKIPAVLAMQRRVGIHAASIFTEHFYSNLALTHQVDVAANEARKQLFLNQRIGAWEWGCPALYMRLANGVPWQPKPEILPPPPPSLEWEGILASLEDDDLIVFLGPGLCQGLLPSADEIAASWASRYEFPLGGERSLPRVSQYIHTNIGKRVPHHRLKKITKAHLLSQLDREDRGLASGPEIDDVLMALLRKNKDDPHELLAQLPISTFITTNFDGMMTAALRLQGKSPTRKVCSWTGSPGDLKSHDEYDDLEGTRESPLVFHLYGNDQDPASQVLTQDDHLDFLRAIASHRETIPLYLRGRLSEALLLFLGYRVTDLDCRVLFRGLIARLKQQGRDRLAVLQIDDYESDGRESAGLQKFVQRYCGGLSIQVYSGSVREFLVELRRRWREESAGHTDY